MSTEIIVVIILSAMAVAGLVWLETKSRRNSSDGGRRLGPRQDDSGT